MDLVKAVLGKERQTFHTLKIASFGGKSSQPSPSKQGKSLEEKYAIDFISPQYPPDEYGTLLEKSTTLNQSVNIMAFNTVGLGWDIASTIKIKEDTPQEVLDEISRQSEVLNRLFTYPNSENSFTEIMVLIKTDEEATGNGYMEVTRNELGIIDGLYWIPSRSIRIMPENLAEGKVGGFVQIRGEVEKPIYFKKFGDKRVLDRYTNKEVEGSIDPEVIASEIIHFKTITISNTNYGIPRYVSATAVIIGSRYVDLRNVNLFENEAIPKFAVIVEGGTLSNASFDALEQFWNTETRGIENAGRTLLLQAEQESASVIKEGGPKIKLQPLTIGITEDASFQGYKSANNNEIRNAFGISEVFFDLSQINRASGDIGRQITNEQVFEPEAKRKEHKIWLTIIRDMISRDIEVSLDVAEAKGREILASRRDNGFISKGLLGEIKAKQIVEDTTEEAFKAFIEYVENTGYMTFKNIRKAEITDVDDVDSADVIPESSAEAFVFSMEPIVRLVFNRSTTQDLVNQATVDTKYANMGALTPNDLRERIGEDPFPDTPEYAWAKYPVIIATVMANRGEILWGGSESNSGDTEPVEPETGEIDETDVDDVDSANDEGKNKIIAEIDRLINRNKLESE